jgi:Methyltransferase FkbM domain
MLSTVQRREWIEHVAANHLWGGSDLVLLDVGASGGIHKRWSAYAERLTAVGFDLLVSEVNRLNDLETRRKVRYEAAIVGCANYDELFPPAVRNNPIASRFNQPFVRSSAVLANQILQRDYVRDVFNAGRPVEYASHTITLDGYLASSPGLTPDFLKIDTDGGDYPVLLGASSLLDQGVLGLAVECQFHGAVHEFANTFSNIDRFLRARGFSLFDLEPHRYSRSALPAPFVASVPAQTVSGQVNWARALYFRDLGEPSYQQMFGVAPTRERLLKLCCLFVSHGLDDCAAELLSSSESLRTLPDRTPLLNALTPRLFGDETYDAYIARFAADPSQWLPSKLPSTTGAPVQTRSDDAGTRVAQLKERVMELKRRNRELRERLKDGKGADQT